MTQIHDPVKFNFLDEHTVSIYILGTETCSRTFSNLDLHCAMQYIDWITFVNDVTLMWTCPH